MLKITSYEQVRFACADRVSRLLFIVYKLYCWSLILNIFPPLRNRDQVMAEISSRRVLLTPENQIIPLTDINVNRDILDANPSLAHLVKLVTQKGQTRPSSPSLKFMRQLKWADNEPSSDRGHLRYYPAGTLVHNLIRDWHENILVEYMNATEVRTPFIYDWSRDDLRGQAGTFYDRLYYVSGYNQEREFVLRFGGDFGQFSLLKDICLSYRQLPLRLFEYAESFRYQRSGEIRGLEQARSFSFFDIHSICTNFSEGWDEFTTWYNLHANLSLQWGIDYALEFTVVDSFFEQQRELLIPLLQYSQRPALIEITSDRKHYWLLKYVFHDEKSHKFFNVQLDQENSTLYGISYTGSDGKNHDCTICHIALGSMQRWMVLAIEAALKQTEPVLPLWLAPTQLRIIPVHFDLVDQILPQVRTLASQGVRIDIDDRRKTVGWRVKQSRMEWIPFVVIIGERELEEGSWSVNIRGQEGKSIYPDALIAEIRRHVVGMPFRPLNPIQVSARPDYC